MQFTVIRVSERSDTQSSIYLPFIFNPFLSVW